MRFNIILILFSVPLLSNAQNWIPTSIADMPVAVSNNAVCEGKINGVDFMYSFGGIDTSKVHQGIHLESYKYNVGTNTWSILPELPDTMGKVAAAASYVKGKVYIIGGYHVFGGGAEVSSSKVHVFDPVTDTYLQDGQDIPTPIDDQAQAVWRDSLIFVISGWSNTGNVNDVQVYDPAQDLWNAGTSVPSTNDFRVFGSQAVIVGDTIYYYGGASMGSNFPATSILRIGVIDPNNPVSIFWIPTQDYPTHPLYRMIGLSNPDGNVTFLGGSGISYNYNGLAYTNSQGVPPANKQVVYNPIDQIFSNNQTQNYPMDLRGYANINAYTKYICGGMEANQEVTNKAYKLTFAQGLAQSDLAKDLGVLIFPNPAKNEIRIKLKSTTENLTVELINVQGQRLCNKKMTQGFNKIGLSQYPNGHYYLVFKEKSEIKFGDLITVQR